MPSLPIQLKSPSESIDQDNQWTGQEQVEIPPTTLVEEMEEEEVQLVRYDKKEREEKNRKSQSVSRLVLDEALEYLNKHGNPEWRDKDKMMCRIVCEYCSPEGQFRTMVANEKLIHRYKITQAWYEQVFVEGFIALVQHDAHMNTPPYNDDKKNSKSNH